MSTPRALGRPAALLALALAATTGVTALSPAAAAPGRTGSTRTVVVTAAAGGVQVAAAAVRASGGTVLATLPLVGGVGAELPVGAVLAPSATVTANSPLTLQGRRTPEVARSASAVRAALGLGPAGTQGAGVTIAVVDTGVDDHADLAGRLTHLDLSGSWQPGAPRDAFGHGTFVAGAAAGDGHSSNGRYAGVAPGASVLDIRVSDDDGETDLLTVLRGLEAAAASGADVVNLSMSSGSPLPYQVDPLTRALDRLWERGVVVVVPSGNDGDAAGSVTSPGVDPVLLTVGALDEHATDDHRDDVVAAFSGRGPAPQGVAKPDLVAPGQSLVSLRTPGSQADREHPSAVVDGAYFRGTGTSFSTALTSGAAAVVLAGRAGLSPDQVKALVVGSAYGAKGLRDARAAGAGALDLGAALAAPTPEVPDAVVDDGPPPGEDAVWARFAQALVDDDETAAAGSWSDLSPAAHRWAASRWAGLSPAAHRWAASRWSGLSPAAHRWAGDDEVWMMRDWASSRWASSRWASSRWASSRWAASRWAGTWG